MSKIAIISDVHANLPALKAVVQRLEKEQPEEWLCLGDLVGYGPHPKECIKLIREKDIRCIKGNHDAGVTGELSLKVFRNPNRKLIELSQSLLEEKDIQWLRELPLTLTGSTHGHSWMAAHASPVHPTEWNYLESAFTIRPILQDLEQDLCFVGHTHRPALVTDTIGLNQLSNGHKALINPGSVGQSRDGDPRASCGLLDLNAFTWQNFRVEYDINPVLNDLEKLGFSRRESEHLMQIR